MKHLFFFIESLTCAGAERSLLTLLSLIDYSKYKVDLQLLQYGGELQRYLPEEVNLLPQPELIKFLNLSLKEQIAYAVRHRKMRFLFARFKYSFRIRRGRQSAISTSRLYWQSFKACVERNSRHYDVAIGYAQGIPTFYVSDKISAGKKVVWINVTHHLEGEDRTFQMPYYGSVQSIVCVSEKTKELFQNENPVLSPKLLVIKDILSPTFIQRQSMAVESPFSDDFTGKRIITVARLSAGQKGMDITLKVCKILCDRGLNFRWYILGKGGFQHEMERYILENKLENHLVLMGVKANPYPYIRNSFLYVQTSRIEGFGLSIAEARILNIPVVTTAFDAVYMQMKHGKNGLVVPIDPVAVADAVESLLTNQQLYDSIVDYLRHEKKGNSEEIENFYQLIGNEC